MGPPLNPEDGTLGCSLSMCTNKQKCQLYKSDVCLENFQFKNVEDAAGRIRKWIKKTPLEVRASSMKYINLLLHDLLT